MGHSVLQICRRYFHIFVNNKVSINRYVLLDICTFDLLIVEDTILLYFFTEDIIEFDESNEILLDNDNNRLKRINVLS